MNATVPAGCQMSTVLLHGGGSLVVAAARLVPLPVLTLTILPITRVYVELDEQKSKKT